MKELRTFLAIVMTVMAIATVISFGVHSYIYESEISAIQAGVAVVVLVPLIISMWQDLRKENA